MRKLTGLLVVTTTAIALTNAVIISEAESAEDASVWSSTDSDYHLLGAADPSNMSPVGGSGQVNGEFTLDTFEVDGHPAQIGLRAVTRFSPFIVVPTGNIYSFATGTSAGSCFGAVSTNCPLWNFDFHVDLGSDELVGDSSSRTVTTIDDVNIELDFSFFSPGQTGFSTFFPIPFPSSGSFTGIAGDFLVQESTNLGFGFFNSDGTNSGDFFDPDVSGRYIFTLTVRDNGSLLAMTSIDVRVGDPIPILSCDGGYLPPFDEPLTLKNKVKRAIPVKMVIEDSTGTPFTDVDVASPPIVMVDFTPVIGGDDTGNDSDLVPAGLADDGNEFRFDDEAQHWVLNLATKQFSAAGTYTVKAVSSDISYEIDSSCSQTFARLE